MSDSQLQQFLFAPLNRSRVVVPGTEDLEKYNLTLRTFSKSKKVFIIASCEQGELDRVVLFLQDWTLRGPFHEKKIILPNRSLFFSEVNVQGLSTYSDFVSQEEANKLFSIFEPLWDSNINEKIRRRVLHFGYKFDYHTLRADEAMELVPFPPFIQGLVGRFPGFEDYGFNQLTVNEYPPNQGIGFHCDTHSPFDDALAVISIGDPLVFEMRLPSSNVEVPIWIESNSLILMTDEARYRYVHGISGRSTDVNPMGEVVRRGLRISLTFRKVFLHKNVCTCQWPEFCDSQNPSSMKYPTRI